MSDVCMNTRETVSLAYDGESVSAAELQTAKLHCTECAECARFVNQLVRLRTVPAPVAPASAIERALAAVSDERVRDAARAAAETRGDVHAIEPQVPPRARARWAPWTGWAAAAAAVFLAVGVVTWQGVAYMNAPRKQADLVATIEQPSVAGESTGATLGGAPQSYSADKGNAQDSYRLAESSAPPYVVFGGFVYEVEDREERLPANPVPLGTVTTDLGSGTPALREVYEGKETGEIIIAADERNGHRALLLTREFDGRLYGMQSPDITVFGTWPSLPGTRPQPSSSAGSPEYEDAGEDASGVTIFVPPGKNPATGFAIAPSTRAGDPAGANPSWTWWSPLR